MLLICNKDLPKQFSVSSIHNSTQHNTTKGTNYFNGTVVKVATFKPSMNSQDQQLIQVTKKLN